MRAIIKPIATVIALLALAFAASWALYMPDSTQRGTWRAQAGGMILDLSRTRAHTYRETSVSCIHDLSFPAHMKLVELAEGATLQTVGAQLHLHIDGSVEPTIFDRINALPATCGPATPETATARDVFDVVYAAMDENYAFFDRYGVDWSARAALAPTTDLTDPDLFALLQTLLAGLDDGHLQLGANELGFFSPSQPPAWFPENHSFSRDSLRQAARNTIGTDLFATPAAPIEFGLRDDNIGYIMIREMDVETGFAQTSERAMAQAFAQVAQALATADAIILDLRYNPGGSDSVAFGVAGHFVATPHDAFTKVSRMGDTTTAPFTATVQPYGTTPLTQPIIVLQSRLTGSAAEILTLALRDLPQVTTLGEPTGGGLSDILGYVLPNTWLFGLSNQTYLTMDGQSFEAVGIPPHIPFDITAGPLEAGQDPLLMTAIQEALARTN